MSSTEAARQNPQTTTVTLPTDVSGRAERSRQKDTRNHAAPMIAKMIDNRDQPRAGELPPTRTANAACRFPSPPSTKSSTAETERPPRTIVLAPSRILVSRGTDSTTSTVRIADKAPPCPPAITPGWLLTFSSRSTGTWVLRNGEAVSRSTRCPPYVLESQADRVGGSPSMRYCSARAVCTAPPKPRASSATSSPCTSDHRFLTTTASSTGAMRSPQTTIHQRGETTAVVAEQNSQHKAGAL